MLQRDLLTTNSGRTIGNGKTTNLWYDTWVSLTKPIQSFGTPTKNICDQMVSDLISNSTVDLNEDKIIEIFPDIA